MERLTDEELIALVDRYFDHEIDTDEFDRLARSLQAWPEHRAVFVRLATAHHTWREWAKLESDLHASQIPVPDEAESRRIDQEIWEELLAESVANKKRALQESQTTQALSSTSSADLGRGGDVGPAHDVKREPTVIVIPRVFVYLAAAACLALVAVLGVELFSSSQHSDEKAALDSADPSESPNAGRVVAQIRSSVRAQWIGLAPGEKRLPVSTPLTLSEGVAELLMNEGAHLVLEAPCVFELTGDNAVLLKSGKLVANVPPSASGFEVVTGNARIIDIGTEFGVIAKPDGTMRADVFQGEIQLAHPQSERSGDSPQSLFAGQAVEADASGRLTVGEAYELSFVRLDEYAAMRDAEHSAEARWTAYTHKMRRDPGLLAYYSFDPEDRGDGRARNTAGQTHGRFGAVLGDGRAFTRPTPSVDRFGRSGRAFSFDHRQAQALYIDDWPDVGALDALTISCWFRLNTEHAPWSLLLAQWHDDGSDEQGRYGFHLSVRDASRTNTGPHGSTAGLQAHLSSDGHTENESTWYLKDEPRSGGETTAQDGWVHVVLTIDCDGGFVRLFKNGQEIDTNGVRYLPPHLPAVSQPLVIGGKASLRGIDLVRLIGNSNLDAFFAGEIDDVALFSRVLSPNEVIDMFTAGHTPSKTRSP